MYHRHGLGQGQGCLRCERNQDVVSIAALTDAPTNVNIQIGSEMLASRSGPLVLSVRLPSMKFRSMKVPVL